MLLRNHWSYTNVSLMILQFIVRERERATIFKLKPNNPLMTIFRVKPNNPLMTYLIQAEAHLFLAHLLITGPPIFSAPISSD